ncbi:hypothetical protein [Advenella mimigardefordensis]|nr:hypothetical protein [Advenella mimigardefordensis]
MSYVSSRVLRSFLHEGQVVRRGQSVDLRQAQFTQLASRGLVSEFQDPSKAAGKPQSASPAAQASQNKTAKQSDSGGPKRAPKIEK